MPTKHDNLIDKKMEKGPLRTAEEIRNHARYVLEKYKRFMRIKATGDQIVTFLQKHRLSPGVDWRGTPKGTMAEYYATRCESLGRNRTFTEETVAKLHEHFGTKEK